MTRRRIVPYWAAATAAAAVFAGLVAAPRAQQTTDAAFCGVRGQVTALAKPLPGASITIRRGDAVEGAASTALDGAYRLAMPAGTYRIEAALPGFDPIQRDVTLTSAVCVQVIDFALSLAGSAATAAPGRGAARGAGPTTGAPARAAGGFQSLPITPQETAAPVQVAGAAAADADPAPFLLPPGFGAEVSADAIAITGAAARVDRSVLNERQQAIVRGDISLTVADLAVALGSQEGGFAGGLAGGFVTGPGGGLGRIGEVLQQAGMESLADLAGAFQQTGLPGRGAGPGGGGGVIIVGGRGRMNMTANYTFGGSILDAAPYPLHGEAREQRPYNRQNFGGTIGGPFRIPGIYGNAANRTSFILTYNGGRGSTLFDQYATVPTAAMRQGDFSSSPAPLIDPLTGEPFAGNRIPADRISPQAAALLPWFPEPNLEGSTRNYRHLATTGSVSDGINLRLTHNFTGGRGGGPEVGVVRVAMAGGGSGGFGAFTGGQTAVILTTQLQVQRRESDQRNVFDRLGGTNRSTSIGLPVSLNVIHGRTRHGLSVNLSRTSSGRLNQFSGIEHVAAGAGIQGGTSDPFGWGLPALSFSSITGLRDLTPTRRVDRRVSTQYSLTRPIGRHTLQVGGDVRFDRGSSYTDSYANGAFVFTGLYTTDSPSLHPGSDFADFLLGLPQQASVQYGPGDVVLTGRAMNLYVMDDWRVGTNLTLNAGLRYELLWPFLEQDGRLVNLDVAPGFLAAAPVLAGEVGPYAGAFPDALLRTDANNLAPRIGLAWRARGETVVRGGYGASYNSGPYHAIARQLASQPPFAVTNTQVGTLSSMLLLEQALLGGTPDETTNNYGVDRDYVLGRVQNWNVDVSRALTIGWAAGATFTHTRGSSLDIVRAPNREADGSLRIDGVQPFLWQTAEGSSVLHSATVRLERRPIGGIGGRVQYTLAQSRDNSPSIGGGNVVAQNDVDIDAEWGRSNFDQRHRLSASMTAELPFGPNRRWLWNGGLASALLSHWRLSAAFSADSGSPLTARVSGAASDVTAGINGALRGDLTGEPIDLGTPSVDRFFNTAAFAVPESGMYGTSGRNIITGPGSKQLDAQFARDVRLGGTRTMSISLRGSNLLNMVNYSVVDTFVNSPTFGQVLGVRPMRSATLNLQFRY